ncbi:Hypothetical protein R9X50_00723000 [Acrodontium crateriforme]|uniref:tRNA (guanine(9)-N1)-methyltransferase n=1 Tax=Acrodontium crateriforme TaxID=150365 RepID=A0AAQ3R7G1_9PEZI|nr:Hypothetical protein R9X50_00723000 [Acrodontium crateriforme]
MDDQERPSKMRKLSHDGNVEEPQDQIMGENLPDAGNGSKLDEITEPVAEIKTQTGNQNSETSKLSEENDELRESLPAPGETAPMVLTETQTPGDPPLSKSQQKKLRRKAEWESKRGERKAIRKEKNDAKKERKREAYQKELAENGGVPKPKVKQAPPKKTVQLPVTLLIDCDFDDLMRDNERVSLAGQITRCYSDNRNALFHAHMAVCSFGGKLRERFDNVLVQHKQWTRVHWLDEDFVAAAEKAKEWMADEEIGGKIAGAFAKSDTVLDAEALEKLKAEGEVVYLSAEADETLTELKPYSTYIIGGLVDKNREKGICHKRATEKGVRTAKLPIGDFLEMSSRKVLTTNHVNEIMIKWLECGDWGESFIKVIPKRKGGKLKGADQASEDDDDNGDAQVEAKVNADEDS